VREAKTSPTERRLPRWFIRGPRKASNTVARLSALTVSTKTRELLAGYTLQTDRLIFRIRAKNEKHPALLPIGETAQFRLHKDRLLLRIRKADGKGREYIVVSMRPCAVPRFCQSLGRCHDAPNVVSGPAISTPS
jgi:hypothetical protein